MNKKTFYNSTLYPISITLSGGILKNTPEFCAFLAIIAKSCSLQIAMPGLSVASQVRRPIK